MSEENKHLTKEQLASAFDVSLTTVSTWIRKGCPYVERGSNGKAWQFSLSQVAAWREKMASKSEQSWRGSHISGTGYASSPALEVLFESRPDLRNGLRFFIEDALSRYLGYWFSADYAAKVLEDIRKVTDSKEMAASILQTITQFQLASAARWIMDDEYNKVLHPEESIDGVWNSIAKTNYSTAPPTDAGKLLFSGLLPGWMRLSPSELANECWPSQKDE